MAEWPDALESSSRRILDPGRGDRRWRTVRKHRSGISKERDPLLDLLLRRLDLLVRMAALEQRLLGMDPHDPDRGLLPSDERVNHLLQD